MTILPFSSINTFMGCQNTDLAAEDYRKRAVGILGIPFDDGVTNRSGARMGPEAIRRASRMLMDGDHPNVTEQSGRPDIYHNFNRIREQMVDLWDMQLPLGNVKKALAMIEEEYTNQLAHFDQIITLGGDHTITLPILRALHKKHGPITLIHFDAHSDCWPDNCGEPYGHGTFLYHAINEGLINVHHSVQIGIRSPEPIEVKEWRMRTGLVDCITARHFRRDFNKNHHLSSLILDRASKDPIYLTFDIDCLDPSVAPGTGTPECGGLFMNDIRDFFFDLCTYYLPGSKFVGMDVVEVCPAYDNGEITSLAAATIVYDYLSALAAKPKCLPSLTAKN